MRTFVHCVRVHVLRANLASGAHAEHLIRVRVPIVIIRQSCAQPNRGHAPPTITTTAIECRHVSATSHQNGGGARGALLRHFCLFHRSGVIIVESVRAEPEPHEAQPRHVQSTTNNRARARPLGRIIVRRRRRRCSTRGPDQSDVGPPVCARARQHAPN